MRHVTCAVNVDSEITLDLHNVFAIICGDRQGTTCSFPTVDLTA